jgi:hypothetical protein
MPFVIHELPEHGLHGTQIKLIDFIDDDQRFVRVGKHLMVHFGHDVLF